MEKELRFAFVYCAIGGLIVLAGWMGTAHYHAEAVSILAGLGCGMLLYDLLVDLKKGNDMELRAWKFVLGMGAGAFVCWGADELLKPPSGLLVAMILNYLIDALVGENKLPMIVATALDNLSLAYVMGARSAGEDKLLYVYAPGIIYAAACLICMKLKPNAPEGWEQLGSGAVVGVVMYTAVIELAPHMVYDIALDALATNSTQTTTKTRGVATWASGVAVFAMVFAAPALHAAVSAVESKRPVIAGLHQNSQLT